MLLDVPFDSVSAAAPLRAPGTQGKPRAGKCRCVVRRERAAPKQRWLWLPVLPGKVAAIAASDAERHRGATERHPVRHRAARTGSAWRCDRRETDKKTAAFMSAVMCVFGQRGGVGACV